MNKYIIGVAINSKWSYNEVSAEDIIVAYSLACTQVYRVFHYSHKYTKLKEFDVEVRVLIATDKLRDKYL